MKGYNRVTLMGNLTRDPEVRYTQHGMACARFSLAVGYSRKKQDDSYEDAADFPTCVVWGKRAEVIGKYFRKGSGILVEGKIQTGSYQDKNGTSGTRRMSWYWTSTSSGARKTGRAPVEAIRTKPRSRGSPGAGGGTTSRGILRTPDQRRIFRFEMLCTESTFYLNNAKRMQKGCRNKALVL